MLIKIIQLEPVEGIPREYQEACIGLVFSAVKRVVEHQVHIVTGEKMPPQLDEVFVVSLAEADKIVRAKDPAVADWYKRKIRAVHGWSENIILQPNEVEVLS